MGLRRLRPSSSQVDVSGRDHQGTRLQSHHQRRRQCAPAYSSRQGRNDAQNQPGSRQLPAQIAAQGRDHAPALVGLDISGASRGTLKGFQSERELSLKISGSSELVGGIAIENGDFKIDGASSLSLVGSAQAVHLSGEGSSHLKLGEFLLKQGQIDLEGASTAQITVKSDALFKAKLSGASTLKGSIQAKEIALELDGASQANLDGKVNDAKIHARARSSLKLPGLVLQNAEIKLSGASHATVDASGKLKYELSSASSLEVPGRALESRRDEIGGFVDLAGAVSTSLSRRHLVGRQSELLEAERSCCSTPSRSIHAFHGLTGESFRSPAVGARDWTTSQKRVSRVTCGLLEPGPVQPLAPLGEDLRDGR